MKYTIDVLKYPSTYEIEADSKEEAISQARDKFYEQSNESIWSVEVTGEEN